MKLYYQAGACSLIVRIILHEIGVAFTDERVDLKTKHCQNGDDFRHINPKGSVPALILDNHEVLTENAVIIQYLADTFQQQTLLPSVGSFQRYRVLECLNFIATDVHKGFSPLFNPHIPEAIKSEVFKPLLKAKLSYLNTPLQQHTYLNGEAFTLPDAYLYVMLRWAVSQGIALNDLSHIVRYVDVLQQRQAVQTALTEEGLAAIHIG